MNSQVIGFKSDDFMKVDHDNLLQYINHQDIKHYGLIPELVGRIPVVAYLNPLDLPTLRRILLEPKNSLIRQYEKLFEMEGIQLTFTDDAINFIAEKALEFAYGARGLRSICEAIMTDAMFELPSQTDNRFLEITRAYAADKLSRSNIGKLKAA